MPVKVLLDTDIGSDIDDAVCLAYLLAQPACELLGITTVTGEAERRAMLASALCRVAGQEVPIFPGAEQPLLVPQKQPHAPQTRALERWPYATRFPRGEAVTFMQRTVRARPGEVVLLTIGPLTNVALLFAVDPEIPALLRELVMMAGLYTARAQAADPREWNARGDPHASAMVFRAPVPALRAVGLDVTRRVQLPAQEVRERFDTPLLRPVRDFAEVWFEQRDTLTFHDPLAAVTLFDPAVCTFRPGTVTVDLEAQPGRTHFKPGDATAPHAVALEVDAGRFFEHFFGVF